MRELINNEFSRDCLGEFFQHQNPKPHLKPDGDNNTCQDPTLRVDRKCSALYSVDCPFSKDWASYRHFSGQEPNNMVNIEDS